MDATLDASNYGSYAFFTAHGSHYGSDVLPMCGPYGYILYGFVYSGYLFWPHLIGELCLKGILAALVLWFWREARGFPLVRWLWLAAFCLFLGGIEDLPLDWIIVLGGFLIISQSARTARGWIVPAMAAGLGFLALVKGTHLPFTLVTLGIALLPALFERRWRLVALAIGGYVGSLVGWWLLAGQRLGDLPAYARAIMELSAGYNAAMVLDESVATFARGAGLVLLLFIFFAWAGWTRRRSLPALASLLLLGVMTFLKWKHGYVRADGHIYIFFSFAGVAALTWLLVAAEPETAWLHRRSRWLALAGIALAEGIVLFGMGDGRLYDSRWVFLGYPGSIRQKFHQLTHLPETVNAFEADLAGRRRVRHLPATLQEIGGGTVDLFGLDQGIILLNNMKYTPRPVGGGTFSTFTPYLIAANGRFMRDPARRPDYFLLKYQTIDNRLASEDDSETLAGLLDHYAPNSVEQNYFLFRQTGVPAPAAPQTIGTRTVRFNETVPVPSVRPDEMLLAAFTIRPSLYGRIRSALYKPPLIFINQLGRELLNGESRRLIPNMASQPIPIGPVLETSDDVLLLYTREEGKTLYSFRLSTDHPAAFAPEIQVTFWVRPRPPLPDRVEVADIRNRARFPAALTEPDAIDPADSPMTARRLIDQVHVQMLMPPSELSWKLEGTERLFTFDYGYDPEAYTRGMSNGTEYIVEIRSPGAPPREIFRTMLDPSHQPADRFPHTAELVLPFVTSGSRLVLRTEPGPFGDNAWDWSYVTNMRIQRGAYKAEQFPGFNRIPDTAHTENASIVHLPEGPVLQLHAPGSLTFRLQGNESHLEFDYGLLPPAYTGEGTTDGAVFTVELIRPNQPRTTLLRRHLQPRTEPADQGRQHAAISLPALGPADQLTVTTDPGPAGNNAWDWTYITHFELK